MSLLNGHVPQKSANYKLVLSTTESNRREVKSKNALQNDNAGMVSFSAGHDASPTRRLASPAAVLTVASFRELAGQALLERQEFYVFRKKVAVDTNVTNSCQEAGENKE